MRARCRWRPDGSGVDLVLDTTPVVTFTSLSGLQTNDATQIVNGTVDTGVDPYAIGTTVSVMENGQVVGQGTVGANGYWSANVTFLNDDGTDTLSATDKDNAGNSGSTTQSLTYNVNTSAAAFTAGNLVISISGDGDGSGSYGDNQASAADARADHDVRHHRQPDRDAADHDCRRRRDRICDLQRVRLLLGRNARAFGRRPLARHRRLRHQSRRRSTKAALPFTATPLWPSRPASSGGEYTAVPRVVADINADGVIDSSTGLYDIFNTNNPRSVATVDGSSFYLSGQGVSGDTTQGVFYATDGASSATSINHATDTRTAEIYDDQLYVSADSKQGATGIFDYGPLSGLSPPSGQVTPTVVIPGTVTLTASDGNTVNGADAGDVVNLSPENFFFANSTTLYVADGGDPKNGGLGDGGLQKWTFNGTQWILDYTLSAGLNLVPDTSSSGTSGLIGLTGEVVGNSVELFATNETLTDLGQTYVYEITDQLDATTPALDESFDPILTASPDENIRGISFAPTENNTPCYCRGTLIQTDRGEVPAEQLSIGDRVITKSGEARSIKWIGRRSYGGRFALGRRDILPICIKAGALDDNVPRRDLWISPHHAMYFKDNHLEAVLIEAKDLVNGVSIVQAERVDSVEYFHIELDSHDVIIAEGALSESFIDDDSRGHCSTTRTNTGGFIRKRPQAQRNICAPRCEDGYEVEAARRRIVLRAGLLREADEPRAGLLRGSSRSHHRTLHRRLGAEPRPSRSAGVPRHLRRQPADRTGSRQHLSQDLERPASAAAATASRSRLRRGWSLRPTRCTCAARLTVLCWHVAGQCARPRRAVLE